MKTLVVLLFAFSLNSLAGTVILEKHATSGFVLPEDSFVKDCEIFREGSVESYTKKGDGTVIGFSILVPKKKIWQIRQLLRIARKAPIKTGPILCDAGDEIVTGHIGKKDILLKERKDCVSDKFRKGWAAHQLLKIAADLCAF